MRLLSSLSVPSRLLSFILCCYLSVKAVCSLDVQKGYTLCDVSGCNCTTKVEFWKNINCTLNDTQELELHPSCVPNKTDEIFINGGKLLHFHPKSFNHLPGLSLLQIENNRMLVIEKSSFHNLTNPSLLIRIQNCDHLTIKTGAFDDMQSSIEAEISDCNHLKIETSAFSRLHIGRFRNVQRMYLASNTFEFRHQGSLKRHGSVTVLTFDNVTIPKIPERTFFSSLATIELKKSHIHAIEHEAFWATNIGAIWITDCHIHQFESDAFVDRTLIVEFRISRSNISKLASRAIHAAIGNLTVVHSRITDIQNGAINATVANAEFVGNEIANLANSALIFKNWNRIILQQNIIKNLRSNFMLAPIPSEVVQVEFTGNDVYNLETNALSFIEELDVRHVRFENNFFNQTCYCTIGEWITNLIGVNDTKKIDKIMNSTYCMINDLLSTCFELSISPINIRNFTELVCNANNTIVCEPYNGETKIVNTTSEIFAENESTGETNWLNIIIICTSILLIAAIPAFVFLLLCGARWLKKNPFIHNIQYSHNEASNDEENTTVTEDESEKFDVPEELTEELLQDLRDKLNDPDTKQEASEMIYRLYEMFVVDDNYNNNQQDEETHLYEELGNLQTRNDDGRSVQQLDEIEQKLYPRVEVVNGRPALAGEYSEPNDAAEHLYSELRQNRAGDAGTFSSTASNMSLRPLPDRPGPSTIA